MDDPEPFELGLEEYNIAKCSCEARPGGTCDYCADYDESYQNALTRRKIFKVTLRQNYQKQQRDFELFLDVTKRKTKCRGCEDSIIKGTPRVGHRTLQKLADGREVWPIQYYHLACWNDSEICKEAGGARSFQTYAGFDKLTADCQAKIMRGELHDLNADVEKPKKKRKKESKTARATSSSSAKKRRTVRKTTD